MSIREPGKDLPLRFDRTLSPKALEDSDGEGSGMSETMELCRRVGGYNGMRAEFEELIDDIADDMGAMGPDVEYCRRDLVDLLEESAAMNRTPRTVCTMAHFVLARRLGTEGMTPNFIDEVAARLAVGYETMGD